MKNTPQNLLQDLPNSKLITLFIALFLFLTTFSTALAKVGEDLEGNLERFGDYEIEEVEELSYTYKNTSFKYVLRNDLVYQMTGDSILDEESNVFMARLINTIMAYGDEFEESMVSYFAEDIKEFIGSDGTTELIGEFNFKFFVSNVEVENEEDSDEKKFLPKIFFSLSHAEIPTNYFQYPSYSEGPHDAPYVIREFTDLQCPFCRVFAARGMPIVKELLKRGDVRYEYHHYPLQSIHPKAVIAGEALECVMAINGKESFWSYHDTLFSQQVNWRNAEDPIPIFVSYARQNRLKTDGLEGCLRSHQYQTTVTTAYQYALYLEIDSTPTIYVNNFIMRPTLEENNRAQELGVHWFTFEDVFTSRFEFSDLMSPY